MNSKKRPQGAGSWLGWVAVLLALAPGASAYWKEKVLYSFQAGTDAVFPQYGLVFDKSGNLYGTSLQGGSYHCLPLSLCGVAFQLQPPARKGDPWTETVLHVFMGNSNGDGAAPTGSLIVDGTGNLYGTTGYGGSGTCILLGGNGGCGTVFELSPPTVTGGAWTETILYNFQGGKDGYFPQGALVFDKAGNLYGATQFGGGFGSCNEFYPYCGTVFELGPPKTKGGAWTEKVLYAFHDEEDGANPRGGLVLDRRGAVYGAAAIGGAGCSYCGNIFRLVSPKRSGWIHKVIHVFREAPDGALPNGGLVFDSHGRLYGTTEVGGKDDRGIVFRLTPVGTGGWPWRETVLHSFTQGADGANPLAGLVFDAKGDLNGTTSWAGGLYANGTVFRMRQQPGGGWRLATLHVFPGSPDGATPWDRVILDRAGNLYGTTEYGGTGGCQGGCGTVFKVRP
jgi:uncharacterized repeat protein (TIGR03803 family)